MHRDVHSRRQMKITRAWQYWIIQYFSFFTAAREKKMFVQYVLLFFKLLLHHGLTSLALKQIYRVENLPLSLLFSEHGQKLRTSLASKPEQCRLVAGRPGKMGCLHKRWACFSEGWRETVCVGTSQCCYCSCVGKYHPLHGPGSLGYNTHEGFSGS